MTNRYLWQEREPEKVVVGFEPLRNYAGAQKWCEFSTDQRKWSVDQLVLKFFLDTNYLEHSLSWAQDAMDVDSNAEDEGTSNLSQIKIKYSCLA